MVEFFKSIAEWFIVNKDNIVVVLTSSNFVAFVSAIILFVKQIKVNKLNNTTNSQINASLSDVSSMKQIFNETESKLKTVTEDLSVLKADTQEAFDKLCSKINAMIDVQSIVYSTIKDESIRKSVSGILLNAKHSESSALVALETEIEQLKEQLAKKAEDIKDVAETAAKKVRKTVSSNKSTTSRY